MLASPGPWWLGIAVAPRSRSPQTTKSSRSELIHIMGQEEDVGSVN